MIQFGNSLSKYMILIIVAIILMVSVFILASSSLKTIEEIFSYPPVLLPRTAQWRNYIDVFRYTDFGEIATCTGLLALAFVVITFISVWGDYFTPLIFLNPNKTLMGVALSRIWNFGSPSLGYTATVLYILPLVVVFFFSQKHILRGVITSGLKG